MQRLNLEEIGRLAGVSRSTVSRVVNGEPNVSESARRRVSEVIAETGYRPHAAARSLASNRTGVFGLVIPSATEDLFNDPYFGRLILGVTKATNALGTTLALLMFDQESGDDTVINSVAGSGFVDGVLLTASAIGNSPMERLKKSGIPLVVIGRPDDGLDVCSVDADNRGGAKTAAQHLASLGRKRIAIISPPSNTMASIDRRSGFLEGLAEAGLSVGDRMAEGDWIEKSGHAAMQSLLKHSPDAVFVATDRMAIGALQAIREAGLSCPGDIALVSFDGLISPSQTSPQLTSVAQPISEVGGQAARLLHSVVSGEEDSTVQLMLPTKLIVRESCGAIGATQ